MVAAGHLDAAQLITHRLALDDIIEAYDVFARPAQTGALKVVLSRT
jgi:alcohol dehydrogenase